MDLEGVRLEDDQRSNLQGRSGESRVHMCTEGILCEES